MATLAQNDLANRLQNLEIAPKSNSLDKPATQFVKTEQLRSSLFKIDVRPGSKAYRYDVEVYRLDNLKSFTKASDDGQKALNKNLCYEAVSLAYTNTNFGWPDNALGEIVYDMRSTLYTNKPIQLERTQIDIPFGYIPNDYQLQTYVPGDSAVIVKILPNLKVPELDLTDIAQYTNGTSLYQEDRSLRTFLELLTSQDVLNRNEYAAIGAGKLFTNDERKFRNIGFGMLLRPGVAKGVKVVKNYGQPTPAIVLDATTCPFFKSQPLKTTIQEVLTSRGGNWDRVKYQLNELRVYVERKPQRTFRIGGFSDKPVSKLIKTTQDKRQMNLVEFYRAYHEMEIDPNMLAVQSDLPLKKGVREYFAVEDLIIMPDQRVPMDKTHTELSQMIIKETAVPPAQRMAKILEHADDLQLFNPNNAVLAGFGITIDKNSHKDAAKVRKQPQMRMGANKIINPNPEKARWDADAKHARLLEPVMVTNTVVLCNFGRERFRPDMNQFMKVVEKRALEKGMKFGNYRIEDFRGDWPATFGQFVKDGVNFVLYVDPRRDTDGHGKLKLCEALYKILTQHVTMERVSDVLKGKIMTLDNILYKTNVKNAGINYEPIIEPLAHDYGLEQGKILVLGYDVAHPPPMKSAERRLRHSLGLTVESLEPSVVGITANVARHPHNFVGDYFYQESRKEAVDCMQLQLRMTRFLQMLKQNRPQHAEPETIVVVRDGISEGQFRMAADEELPALKAGCEDYRRGYHPKFVFVIGTKRHFKRFMVERNGRLENMAPGSVVEEKFTRTDCPEFYMQSHYPIQGTGKAVQYAVPINETKITRDQLQALLNALCFEHQIVTSAISLPEPVYQADELAKRGFNNYKEMKAIMPQNIPRHQQVLVDGPELTKMLGYMDSKLQATRFTA
ncbi:CSR-1 protein [Aphelenchoides avenae]|nr:CSR-1 protein [Aphelenchus avenae]